MWINNPFGEDVADVNEETAADRIGERIRKVRKAKGWTPAQLGEAVGNVPGSKGVISADMISKYENGQRKPKFDRLKDIATALGVETIALLDPVTANYIGAMYAMFEMEQEYGCEPVEINGRMYVTFGDGIADSFSRNLQDWMKKRQEMKENYQAESDPEKKAEILNAYHMWEWNYPKPLADDAEKRAEKARLESKIQKLQEQLKQMDGNE